MSPSTRPEEWTPIGVESLETAADEAVRSDSNELVIAGPGAGKTELLAQRACYLLQTGLCHRPNRILAISFKRDAARNLRERVLKRCGPELAGRFDSMTFDAFAKSLLDRFRAALPAVWRPTGDYEIDFSIERDARKWVEQIPDDEGGLSAPELASLNVDKMYAELFVGGPLTAVPVAPTTLRARAAASLWQYLLHHGGQSRLNFHMIGRLSELLLRSNPKILRALRSTYGYVFLDEFQDTTGIQFALAKTAFMGSDSVLTAVGDNKQRIMGWAGALDGVFGQFQTDFEVAKPIRLENNYRSAPEIVRVLGYLSAALDPDAAPPVAVDDGKDGNGECRVLLFADHEAESNWVAESVAEWLETDGLAPREICLLTRMRPGDYTETIRTALQERGIEARIESELQDLLAEPVVIYSLHVLRLATRSQAPESRLAILDLLADFDGGDPEVVGRKLDGQLAKLVKAVKSRLSDGNSLDDVRAVLGLILDCLGRSRLGVAFPQYAQGRLLDDTVEAMAKALAEYAADREWASAVDALEGVASVPIMTMHKSKGLEYDTVVFVGLEDSAHWNFAKSQAEETRGFFVALSRAAKRVVFTFCKQRPKYAGKPAVAQQRSQIGKLYSLLEEAGIKPEEIE